LPWGLLVDKWRWQVASGEVKPENYNAAWWKLREQYQGIKAPEARGEEHLDPGAKLHVPGSVSYTRYFVADIMQFQWLDTQNEGRVWLVAFGYGVIFEIDQR
jgi:peptidyl-dipeptidase A